MPRYSMLLIVIGLSGSICVPGCGGGSSGNGVPDSAVDSDSTAPFDSTTGPDSTVGPDSSAGGPTFGSGSNFSSTNQFFDYVNDQRENYAPHDRYAGFPFSGGYYHTNVTWPYTMQWSDTAAAVAQVEADAVAGGSAPSGQETFANPGQLPIYIDGLNTVDYMVGGRERPGSFTTDTCTLCNANPFMRMGVFYHDPGGDGPVLTRLGIGAADMGNGDTWWVMKFEQ